MFPLTVLLLPPGGLIVAAFLALVLRRYIPRVSAKILTVCVTGLYALSMPILSTWALGSLQPKFIAPNTRQGAQAIVVLAGGTHGYAEEYGADTVNHLSLIRLRYAAKLHRMTGLPVLAAGGNVRNKTITEAEQLQAVLTEEIGIPVQWVETHSIDTFTNASESAKILKPAGIDRIFLVTHAWHMPRARLAFEHAGLTVIPAPTGFVPSDQLRLTDFLPHPSALVNSYYFFHEIVGYAVYAMRARF